MHTDLHGDEAAGDENLGQRAGERRHQLGTLPGREDAIDTVGARQQRRVHAGEAHVEPDVVEVTDERLRLHHLPNMRVNVT